MRVLRTIWLLGVLALLFSAVAPEALASWQCEGRACGISMWACCCIGPAGARDQQCASLQSAGNSLAERGAGVSACPSNCKCEMITRSVESIRPAITVSLSAPYHCPALPVAPVSLGQVPTQRLAHSIESRGPPLPLLCLSTPVLRGPPALTFPSTSSLAGCQVFLESQSV